MEDSQVAMDVEELDPIYFSKLERAVTTIAKDVRMQYLLWTNTKQPMHSVSIVIVQRLCRETALKASKLTGLALGSYHSAHVEA